MPLPPLPSGIIWSGDIYRKITRQNPSGTVLLYLFTTDELDAIVAHRRARAL